MIDPARIRAHFERDRTANPPKKKIKPAPGRQQRRKLRRAVAARVARMRQIDAYKITAKLFRLANPRLGKLKCRPGMANAGMYSRGAKTRGPADA